MLTVLQVIPNLEAGGAERTTIEIAEALTQAGHRGLVASVGGRLEGELAAAGGVLLRVPLASINPLTLWANRGALLTIIRREGVDIVHARSRAPAWSALWAARAAKIPFVTTYHGAYNARNALKRWYNAVMARGDVVIANSHFIADHIRREHAFAADRITVIPRGVDVAAFRPDAVSVERIAAQRVAWDLAADDPRPVILMPGRLTRWKGQEIAIDALAALKARGGPAAVLVMPGDHQGRHDYVAGLHKRIAAAGLRDSVRLPGHCSDMPAAFRAADVVVSASIEPEAFGRVAAEAQCAQRLVIASDHGGARETVDPDVGGWRVPPGDPEALAQALAGFFALEPTRRAALEAAVAARARAVYATAALQRDTLAVYGRIT